MQKMKYDDSQDRERQEEQERERRQSEIDERARLAQARLMAQQEREAQDRERLQKEAAEREQLIHAHREELLTCLNRVDVRRVQSSCSALMATGRSLRELDVALAGKESHEQTTADIAAILLAEGRRNMSTLLDELRAAGVLALLERITRDSRGALPMYDVALLQEWETQALQSLGVDADAHAVLESIFTEYVNDRSVSFDSLLLEASDILSHYDVWRTNPENRDTETLRLICHCSFKMFAGLSLGTMNALAIWSTWGLVMTLPQALQSWVTGSALAMDGVRILRGK